LAAAAEAARLASVDQARTAREQAEERARRDRLERVVDPVEATAGRMFEAIQTDTEAKVQYMSYMVLTAAKKMLMAPIKPEVLPNGQIRAVKINFINAAQGKKATVPDNIVAALPALTNTPSLMRVMDVAIRIQEILTSVAGNKNDQLLMMKHCFDGIQGVSTTTVEQTEHTLERYLSNAQLFSKYKTFVITPRRYPRETLMDFLIRVTMHANILDKSGVGLNDAFAAALRDVRNYPDAWKKEHRVAFNAVTTSQPKDFDNIMHIHRQALEVIHEKDSDGKRDPRNDKPKVCGKCGKKHTGKYCPKNTTKKHCKYCNMNNHSTEECTVGPGGRKKRERGETERTFVPPAEVNRRKEAGLCIKCGDSNHQFRKCTNGWTQKKPKTEQTTAE
jgi:hypothetical protein